MNLPLSLTAFINAKPAVQGVLCLPEHYPLTTAFEKFQAGYRYNAITGEYLTGETPGKWQPGWYVLCRNYFDDPFFVDVAEEEQGFPVYYAAHGAGKWTAQKVADNLEQFQNMLAQLKAVVTYASQAAALIATFPFSEKGLWQEVLEEINEAGEEE